MTDLEHKVRQLVGHGLQQGTNFYCLNPYRDDKHIGSLCICTRGSKAGAWKDFSSGESGGSFASFEEFMRTGITPMYSYRGMQISKKHRRSDAYCLTAQKNKQSLVKSIWENSINDEKLHKYLHGRNLDPPYDNIRFSYNMKHGPSNKFLPAMIGRIQNEAGIMVGVHRTYLEIKDNEVVKAEVLPVKMILGELIGCHINIGFERSNVRCKIAVCEGIETGMSINKIFKCPVKCMLTANNMINFRCDFEKLEVLICADNDKTGQKAARDLAYKLSVFGANYKILYPTCGSDFNDQLMDKYDGHSEQQ